MITVSADSIRTTDRHLVTHAQTIAPQAAALVNSRFGALPHVCLILTAEPRRMAQLACQAEFDLVTGVHAVDKFQEERRTRRNARDASGVTVLAGSGALVVINTRMARTADDITVTTVHELVHTHQLNSPAAREQHMAYLRHELGVGKLPRRDVRAYEALIDRRETQARKAEALASQIGL
ncbi:hypothetical protein ACH4PU_30620 [Streptomyces sp. NPDC021100]|uniref:hypothetical protein n=1 Tax=Streptomyces sp. NPDC021100 TaxID=3365114 RepID=UPI0037AFCD06